MSACCPNYPNCKHATFPIQDEFTTAEPSKATTGLVLNFKKVEDTNGDTLECCLCNRKSTAHDEVEYLRADIPIAAKVSVTIYVCGERCQKNLLTSKESLRRLEYGIANVRKENRKRAIKAMGRRFGVLLLFALVLACATPKVQHRPRYQSGDKYLNAWLTAEYPKKVAPTGEKKRKKRVR